MENQTRFDLNAAVENWRNELAAQPNLASDDRRELETHLRDLISEFRREGLNDEESFRLACKKTGELRQVGVGFQKNRTVMIKGRAIGLGVRIGLAMGFVMMIGLWLALRADSIWVKPFVLLNMPAVGLCGWLHNAAHDLGLNAGFSESLVTFLQLFVAFLIYWIMLGALAGLGSHIWLKLSQNRKAPRHFETAMENQTRFDLNAAIENWRNELAVQPNLAPDDRRELETHLRDTISEFQRKGLSGEESFWLARRRVGQPQQLGEEFVKANPANVWRGRVFWMTTSLVGSYAFTTWKDFLWGWLNPSSWTRWLVDQGFYLIPVAVLVGTVVLIRRRKVPNLFSYAEIAFQSSWKPTAALFLILTATVLTVHFRGQHCLPGNDSLTVGYNYAVWQSWFDNAWWPSVMVLILLLTLKRNRKTPKRA